MHISFWYIFMNVCLFICLFKTLYQEMQWEALIISIDDTKIPGKVCQEQASLNTFFSYSLQKIYKEL